MQQRNLLTIFLFQGWRLLSRDQEPDGFWQNVVEAWPERVQQRSKLPWWHWPYCRKCIGKKFTGFFFGVFVILGASRCHLKIKTVWIIQARIAQLVSYRLGTGEVPGSNPSKGENFSMKISNSSQKDRCRRSTWKAVHRRSPWNM